MEIDDNAGDFEGFGDISDNEGTMDNGLVHLQLEDQAGAEEVSQFDNARGDENQNSCFCSNNEH